MKTRILLVALLTGWSAVAFGQYYKPQHTGVKFSVLAEPIVTWFKSDNTTKAKPVGADIGLNIGLATDFHFAPNYAFGTGLSWTLLKSRVNYQQGTTLEKGGKEYPTLAKHDVNYRLQYVKIPLGLKLRTHRIGRFRYFADLGFDVFTRLSAHAGFTEGGKATNFYQDDIDVKNSASLFALGFHFGGGLQYSIGGDAAVIGGVTFGKILTDQTSGKAGDDIKLTANMLALRLGFSF